MNPRQVSSHPYVNGFMDICRYCGYPSHDHTYLNNAAFNLRIPGFAVISRRGHVVMHNPLNYTVLINLDAP